jgi:hypothetical protein
MSVWNFLFGICLLFVFCLVFVCWCKIRYHWLVGHAVVLEMRGSESRIRGSWATRATELGRDGRPIANLGSTHVLRRISDIAQQCPRNDRRRVEMPSSVSATVMGLGREFPAVLHRRDV